MNTKFDKNNNQNVNANKDMVNHPSHYQSESGLEVIDVIKAFTSNLTVLKLLIRAMFSSICAVGRIRTALRI